MGSFVSCITGLTSASCSEAACNRSSGRINSTRADACSAAPVHTGWPYGARARSIMFTIEHLDRTARIRFFCRNGRSHGLRFGRDTI